MGCPADLLKPTLAEPSVSEANTLEPPKRTGLPEFHCDGVVPPYLYKAPKRFVTATC